MSTLTTDGYRFDFPKAKQIIKFDGVEHGFSHCMKAVDVVVELNDETTLFIEIKEERANKNATNSLESKESKQAKRNFYDDLKYKHRDSYIYRYCEDALTPRCYYICLLDFDSALLMQSQRVLRTEAFPKKMPMRWKKNYIEDVFVVNAETWANSDLSKWGTITKI
ncbi:hypothetical protein [Porphyromonas levii]|uniref:hypothetical protein n=1 Tax=Porphyromonas levii TaxID=28114 RepID=UPI001BACD97C|nr:hypothetical protein [Porphyromonas levii]MBR8807140.1 hypothetical protein [Porphyromonas levii]